MNITPIPGYEKYYGATEDGRIFSFNYRRSGKTKELAQSERTDKRRKPTSKYKRAKMHFINTGAPTAIHRVIALTFIKNPNNYPCVNHIDGNKSNNHASNLEWCTHKQNNRHAEDNGLINHSKGEDHGMRILSEFDVVAIRKQLDKSNYRGQLTDIGDKYGVSRHCIFDIKHHRSWRHI